MEGAPTKHFAHGVTDAGKSTVAVGSTDGLWSGAHVRVVVLQLACSRFDHWQVARWNMDVFKDRHVTAGSRSQQDFGAQQSFGRVQEEIVCTGAGGDWVNT